MDVIHNRMEVGIHDISRPFFSGRGKNKERGIFLRLRKLAIIRLFEKDPPCLGGEGGGGLTKTPRISSTLPPNFFGFKI